MHLFLVKNGNFICGWSVSITYCAMVVNYAFCYAGFLIIELIMQNIGVIIGLMDRGAVACIVSLSSRNKINHQITQLQLIAICSL